MKTLPPLAPAASRGARNRSIAGRAMRLRACAAILALAGSATGCGLIGGGSNGPVAVTVVHGQATETVTVDGDSTIGEVLEEAHIVPKSGRVRSAKAQRSLGPNGHPAALSADGQRVTKATRLDGRHRIRVVDGADSVEDTRVVRRAIVPTGLPKALQYVQYAGNAGIEEAVVGVQSEEVLSQRVVQPMVPVHRATGKVLALTFDDGPDARFTPQVLDILKRKKVPAAFCEVGAEVDKHPELTRRIVKLGHQLCNHTQHHVEGLELQPRSSVEAEIQGGRGALERAGGTAPAFYRPPGGSLGPVIYDVAADEREAVLYWSVDPRDWKRPSAKDLVIRVVSQMRPGAIILLHDGGGDRQPTIDALPAIIDYGKALGYTFVVPVSGRSAVG